ncbi:Pentatricopeptide repeat-containing protein [Artemisia annua]|uniref:Pentatricopeptide repeat-containing protein n=1 Tax=Artemisia annua TaxID=35608 RepID=A0A2U1L541_ARTAN|nr:Pentatricopeptide repeat-containing protein [Artemisia annua]
MVGSGMRPDEFSLSTIINACTGLRDINQGRKIHGYLVKHGYTSDPFSCNALVDMYSKVGNFEDAKAVFEHIPKPDIVLWNAVIAGCVLHEDYIMALELMLKMRRSGITPNMFTFSSVLKACSGLGLQDLGPQFHCVLIKSDIELDPFLCCGLIDIYAKCGEINDATRVYDMMPEKELIALNALLCGYSHNNSDIEALSLFAEKHRDGIGFNETTLLAILNSAASLQVIYVTEQVHGLSLKTGFEADPFVINSLIDSYAKCGHLAKATMVFDESPVADLATFTSLISAYAQTGQGEEAIKLYLKMQDLELKPDSFICSSLINTAASLSAYEQGKQIHVHTLKFGLLSDVFTANSLVNMYARCGNIDDANRAFSEVPKKGIVSWSAMIGGLAQHGHGKEALSLFDEMLEEGVAPNNITLHYACMIDILGRVGKLDEAMDLVSNMPFEANASVWGALLGVAKTHKNVDLGEIAAHKLMLLEPEKSGTHVILSDIYASAGLWENVVDVRRLVKDSKVKKEPGISWIEVKDSVHSFVVHSMTDDIYAKLAELVELVSKEGYVPVLEIDLHNVKNSEKELLLSYHSEKLTVAFGLIATPPRAPIRVQKNLRVCIDCHTFLKYVSNAVAREIIVRDIKRFHHFRDGSCSCGDYCGPYMILLLQVFIPDNNVSVAELVIPGSDLSQHIRALQTILSDFASYLEAQAYMWAFDIRNWLEHLNPLTWPEVLRQIALSAGFGPHLKKDKVKRSSLPEMDEKTGLRDLTTSKTPDASISVALSRDPILFERVAPSTYCVRPPHRKDPADADEKDEDFESEVAKGREIDLGTPSTVNEGVGTSSIDQGNTEIDGKKSGESWVQGLTEGEYSDLCDEERLNARVALISVANEGNIIRLVLEDRLDAATAV